MKKEKILQKQFDAIFNINEELLEQRDKLQSKLDKIERVINEQIQINLRTNMIVGMINQILKE